ncbi:hypothetical protein [Infirmifilum uzonense]|uniref:hypothetical protein n=1 Tax=Infirmifilum uzonense TaxID=1550241 RepID=UPI003C788307
MLLRKRVISPPSPSEYGNNAIGSLSTGSSFIVILVLSDVLVGPGILMYIMMTNASFNIYARHTSQVSLL